MSHYLGWKGKFNNDKQLDSRRRNKNPKYVWTYQQNFKIHEAKLIKLKGKIYKSVINVGDFNTTLSETEIQITLRNCYWSNNIHWFKLTAAD